MFGCVVAISLLVTIVGTAIAVAMVVVILRVTKEQCDSFAVSSLRCQLLLLLLLPFLLLFWLPLSLTPLESWPLFQIRCARLPSLLPAFFLLCYA